MTGIRVISEAGRQDSLDRAARIRREVREHLDNGELHVTDQSGRHVAAGAEWCEEKGLPYTIQAVPGALYTLHVDEITPEMEPK